MYKVSDGIHGIISILAAFSLKQTTPANVNHSQSGWTMTDPS